MTCEWAEGYLSAYLDDALDPQLRKDVGAHIEQCARCRVLAEEFRRNDALLAKQPQVAPSDALRQQIFESSEFAALARELERAEPRTGRRVASRKSVALRAAVPVAAALAVSLGAGMFLTQGHLPFGAATTSHQQHTTIGGPGSFDLPLSAGPRLVFLNGGALWSVAEYAPGRTDGAPGAPQRLTATNVHVVAWSVSPLGASAGGTRIAYVDGATGALHVVQSDGQLDTIVGYLTDTHAPGASFWSSADGRAALSSLAWASDGSQLAYVALNADNAWQARIYALSGSTTTIATSASAPISRLTWSSDSSALAFTTTLGGSPALGVWRGAGSPLTTVAVNPNDAQASVAQIGWSGDALTWSIMRDGALIGVNRLQPGSDTPQRLTPAGASYDAADYTTARGGVWLLAGNGALTELRTLTGDVSQVASLYTSASTIVWSPDGATATVQTGDQLALWSEATGLNPLTTGVSATTAPVWSPDGSALVVTKAQRVMVYRPGDGSSAQVAQLSAASGPIALAWAADGRNLAVAELQGTLLVATNGARQTLLTSHLAEGAALGWSIAR